MMRFPQCSHRNSDKCSTKWRKVSASSVLSARLISLGRLVLNNLNQLVEGDAEIAGQGHKGFNRGVVIVAAGHIIQGFDADTCVLGNFLDSRPFASRQLFDAIADYEAHNRVFAVDNRKLCGILKVEGITRETIPQPSHRSHQQYYTTSSVQVEKFSSVNGGVGWARRLRGQTR